MSSRIDATRESVFEMPGSDIKKMGILRKLKTMKKKFFVLRSTSSSGPARLEYYDSQRKFRSGQTAKRTIHIHTCFNINKKSDSKHKYAIALYTKDDCFSVLAENQDDQDSWLELLLKYQYEFTQEQDKYEHYEHVWQVTIQPKGLGVSKNIRGNFRLCLSSQYISIVKVNCDKPLYKFQLATVRSLAYSDCLFRMEVGNWAPTGRGELWMNVEDSVIAKNMHEAILNCMTAQVDYESLDEQVRSSELTRSERNRSGSMNHGERPLGDARRYTISDNRTHSPIRQKYSVRPMSSVNMSRSAAEAVSTGTSPCTQSCLLIQGSHRFRSDSMDSRSSHQSGSVGAECNINSADFFGDSGSEHGEKIDEEDMSDTSSIPATPKQVLDKMKHDYEEDPSHASPYMAMTSGNVTPPTATTAPCGYIDMTFSTHLGSHETGSAASEEMNTKSYMNMNMNMNQGPPPPSEPIPIRVEPKAVGYMDMCPGSTSHSTPLPTVREGGSNEGYLPMSPTFDQSPIDTSMLRPTPTTCLLTDDSGELPKRTYSLGSKPPARIVGKTAATHDSLVTKKSCMDNGKSCSAPHLLLKGRNVAMESPAPSPGALSTSYKSDSSYRSDDSDSFMELDFHRPRTASDSYSCRPRASSFGKAFQGHRPRSSSYGHQAKPFKMKLGSKLGSYELVRMTSQELMHRPSVDSMSYGSRDSLRMSSSESLRRLSEEVRTKTNLLNTEYVDMNMEKRKTPSPLPAGGRAGGYMDMTIGSRSSSPSRGRVSGSEAKPHRSNRSDTSADDSYMNMESADVVTAHSGLELKSAEEGRRDAFLPQQKSCELPRSVHSDLGDDSYMVMESTDVVSSRRSSEGSRSGEHVRSVHKDSTSQQAVHKDNTSQHAVHKDSTSQHVARTPAHPVAESDYISFEPGKVDSQTKKPDFFDIKPHRSSAQQTKPPPTHESAVSKKTSSAATRVFAESRKPEHHTRPEHQHQHQHHQHQQQQQQQQEVYVLYEPRDQYVMYEPHQTHFSDSQGSSESLSKKSHSKDGSSNSSSSKESKKKKHSKSKKSSKGFDSERGSSVESVHPLGLCSSAAKRIPQKAEVVCSQHKDEVDDEYIEICPLSKTESASQKRKSKIIAESEYIGFEPGLLPGSKQSTKTPAAVKSMISVPPADNKSEKAEKEAAVSGVKSEASSVKPKQAGDIYFSFEFGKGGFPPADSSDVKGQGCEKTVSTVKGQGCEKSVSAAPASKDAGAEQLAGARISQCSTVPISGFVFNSSSNSGKKTKDKAASEETESRGEKSRSKHNSGGSFKGVSMSQKEKTSPASSKGVVVDVTTSSDSVRVKHPSGGSLKGVSVRDESGSTDSRPKHVSGGSVTSETPRPVTSETPRVKHSSGGSVRGVAVTKVSSEISDSSVASPPPAPAPPPHGAAETLDPSTAGMTRPGSTPCMLTLDESEGKPTTGTTLNVESNARSRHSIADLSAYEQMSFSSNTLSTTQPLDSSEKVLNYASLDLGSSEAVGDNDQSMRSPRVKSRHPSCNDDRAEPPLSYASIDFEKSESLKNAGNKDVKFTL